MLDGGQFNESNADEFFENSIDAIPEPSIEDLLGASVVSITEVMEVAKTAYISGSINSFGDYNEYSNDKEYRNDDAPVANHPNGHLFNKVNGILFCACDCENCNGAIPVGRHYPSCICTECECYDE